MNTALSVNEISVSLPTAGGKVRVVDRVSFDLQAGEMIGLAGESGCGKSMLAMGIMGLLGDTAASVQARSLLLDGHAIDPAKPASLDPHRGRHIAMVFQEPATALDPVFTIGWQLSTVLIRRFDLSRSAARDRAIEALTDIGFAHAGEISRAYPHQLSGGMRQLVMLAMASAVRPGVLIADEPTTALDVTTQQLAMRHLRRLQADFGTAILLITHDIGLIAEHCSRILVMYCGRIVESAEYAGFYRRPLHPYSAGLLAAVPRVAMADPVEGIPGHVRPMTEEVEGCVFAERCFRADADCRKQAPALQDRGDRQYACHHPL